MRGHKLRPYSVKWKPCLFASRTIRKCFFLRLDNESNCWPNYASLWWESEKKPTFLFISFRRRSQLNRQAHSFKTTFSYSWIFQVRNRLFLSSSFFKNEQPTDRSFVRVMIDLNFVKFWSSESTLNCIIRRLHQ